MLSEAQRSVFMNMERGAVIGVFEQKTNSHFELFSRKPGEFIPKSNNDHPFVVKRLNKNTVFILLGMGLIMEDKTIKTKMRPFSRDTWYKLAGNLSENICSAARLGRASNRNRAVAR